MSIDDEAVTAMLTTWVTRLTGPGDPRDPRLIAIWLQRDLAVYMAAPLANRRQELRRLQRAALHREVA